MRTNNRPSGTILILPILVILAACQKENDSAPITELTLQEELEFSVAPGQEGALDLTTVFDARASVSRLLQEKGFALDLLKDVRIEDSRAVMIQPVNDRFDPVESVRLEFTQAAGTAFRFAHLDPVPDGQAILDLFVDHADLTPFFTGEPQTVHARLQTSQRISEGTARVRFALTFRVRVGI